MIDRMLKLKQVTCVLIWLTVYTLNMSNYFDTIRYTTKKDNTSYTGYAVYAFVLDWPDDDNWLYLGSVVPSEDTRIHMLGYNTLLFSTFTVEQPGLRIRFPSLAPHQLPSLYAWVLKLINVKPLL